jgi:hypothetical protein
MHAEIAMSVDKRQITKILKLRTIDVCNYCHDMSVGLPIYCAHFHCLDETTFIHCQRAHNFDVRLTVIPLQLP